MLALRKCQTADMSAICTQQQQLGATARRGAAATTTEAETWLKFHGDAFSIIKINKKPKSANNFDHKYAATFSWGNNSQGGNSSSSSSCANYIKCCTQERRGAPAGGEKRLCDFHTIILYRLQPGAEWKKWKLQFIVAVAVAAAKSHFPFSHSQEFKNSVGTQDFRLEMQMENWTFPLFHFPLSQFPLKSVNLSSLHKFDSARKCWPVAGCRCHKLIFTWLKFYIFYN